MVRTAVREAAGGGWEGRLGSCFRAAPACQVDW